ncbi:cytochrome c oxidase assembly protein [Roseitranquillus sediminis]|uniref:cytochrome c oxidase assembly protein n=1 Tax=Roseitranquillus sediminis TaxID=2809051 RepID=UPI001D0C212F|nr:cytochrome c oxidase assembly protein [Roseitranquillus sediminis]MBM9596000.1 cytochrome c oxidase assembly protein [Roseitranquillus sediminis]
MNPGAALLALIATPAMAHGDEHVAGWSLDPLVIVPLGIAAVAYAGGLVRLWSRAGAGRGLSHARVVTCAVGFVLAALFLVSPLDALAERLLAAHMIQHFGLMLIAAPLIVLGRPGLALLWDLPTAGRSAVSRISAGRGGRVWRGVGNPFVAWSIYFVTLWVWHMPALYQAAVRNDALHAAQHFSFFGAALLFWYAVLERPRAEGRAGAFAAIFATAVQSCVLAALLTTARTLWYPVYATGPGGWGLSPMQDQQLGGLIMWVPCCAVMIGAGVAVFAQLLRDAEARAERSPL